jgi:toxin ParE1/3/4
MNYALTPSAQTDLEEIWRYIAEDNPDEADKLEADIYKACQLLVKHPEIGNKRPVWTQKPVRFWPVRKNYLIVYVPESEPMEVLRIFHTARDVPTLMRDE